MKYRTYKLNCETIARAARKSKLLKFKKKEKAESVIQRTMHRLYTTGQDMRKTMECVIHAEEFNWLRSSKVVYFPIDCSMAENIMRGSYKITNPTALYDGPESFILNLPDGLKFNDDETGSGLMITIMPLNDRASKLYNDFMEWIDCPPVNVINNDSNGDFSISVVYQSQSETEYYMRLMIPSENAVRILHMETNEQYVQYMKDTNQFDYKHGTSLMDDELAYQFEMMRFICGFLVYKKALPERIIKGLPSRGLKEVSTPVTKDKTDYYVKHPSGHQQERTGHYRSWHFRQLMNERYYRGEYANLEIGSRVIFISDSYISKDVDARTVEAQ